MIVRVGREVYLLLPIVIAEQILQRAVHTKEKVCYVFMLF